MCFDLFPIGIIAVAAALIGGVIWAVERDAERDARAPIVETCVKHPATRSPFR